MRILTVLIAASLFAALSATAQDENSSKTVQPSSDNAKMEKVEGCLSMTNGFYVITGGNQPKQYRIIGGDTSTLKNKRGHTVRVTGTLGQSDPVANTIEPPNEGTTTGGTYSTLVITSVKDITSNCSYPGSGK